MPGKKVQRGSEAALALFAEYNFEPLQKLMKQAEEIQATLNGDSGTRADRAMLVDLLFKLAEYRHGKPGPIDGGQSGLLPGGLKGIGFQINVLQPGESPPQPGAALVPDEADAVDAEIVEVEVKEKQPAPLPDPDWLQ